MAKVTFVLIETYWNVKANICQRLQLPDSVLIETYWNVKINEPNTEGGENTDQDEQEQETAETNEPDTDQEGGEDDGEENELHKKKSNEKND